MHTVNWLGGKPQASSFVNEQAMTLLQVMAHVLQCWEHGYLIEEWRVAPPYIPNTT